MAERGSVDEKAKQECWKVMTFCEKMLVFALVLTVLLLIGALVYIGLLLLSEPDVCETSTCIKASADLLELTDFDSNPCEDFFAFTCGNYIPQQGDCEDDWEPRQAILTIPPDTGDSEDITVAKRFFQTCINVDEGSSTMVLQRLVSQIGGWPLIVGKHWRDDYFHWLKFIALKLRPRGIESDWFLSFDYHVDEDGVNLLLIGPPDLEKISNRHKKRHESMALAAGKLSDDFVLEDLTSVVEFEQALESIIRRTLKAKNATKMSVIELNRLWPEVQLVHILNNLTRGHAAFANSTLIMAHEYYLYELNLLLRKTNTRTQVNFLVWKIVESYLPFLSENFRQAYYEKYSDEDDIEDHCFMETMKRFYSSVESFMIRNEDDEVFRSINSMASRILKAADESYADSEEAKVVIVGLQGENSGITNFRFKTHNIISMINEVHTHVEDKFYNCLDKPSSTCSRETYYYESKIPEIRFDVNQTTIYVPSDLLSNGMYEWDQPNFVNYARLGWRIGDTVVEALQKENIYGMDLAYEAYVQLSQDGGMDGKLPAIDYTVKQLFWIHSCSIYCKSENISTHFDEVKKSQNFRDDFKC